MIELALFANAVRRYNPFERKGETVKTYNGLTVDPNLVQVLESFDSQHPIKSTYTDEGALRALRATKAIAQLSQAPQPAQPGRRRLLKVAGLSAVGAALYPFGVAFLQENATEHFPGLREKKEEFERLDGLAKQELSAGTYSGELLEASRLTPSEIEERHKTWTSTLPEIGAAYSVRTPDPTRKTWERIELKSDNKLIIKEATKSNGANKVSESTIRVNPNAGHEGQLTPEQQIEIAEKNFKHTGNLSWQPEKSAIGGFAGTAEERSAIFHDHSTGITRRYRTYSRGDVEVVITRPAKI